MARRKLYRTGLHPYHVTARANNQDWFTIPMAMCWEIFQEKLALVAERYGVWAHAFVLMSNHFHLLLTTPNANLDPAMRYLLTEVSRAIARATGRINHVFGSRYKWSVLMDQYAIAYVYKYVCRNPVRAGLVDRVETYPFGTLFRLLNETISIPLSESQEWRLIPRDPVARLNWLNKPLPKEREELIKRALRRATFQFSRDKKVELAVRKLQVDYLEV